MNPHTLTQTLHGAWHGSYGCAPCPICQTEARVDQRALTISEGHARLLLHCKKSGCSYRDIVAALKMPRVSHQHANRKDACRPDPVMNNCRRSDVANAIWNSGRLICGTLAETYLRSRAITCPLSDALRFHPDLWHGPARRAMPAMIARIEGSSGVAVHRTWLRPDGHGKAEVLPAKTMLGPSAGGAVRLREAKGPLIITEGIETALSVICMLHRPASVWAALSTSGMRGLSLPIQPGVLILAPDGDTPGRAAARALADRAKSQGWTVGTRDPGDHLDWNDVLQRGQSA